MHVAALITIPAHVAILVGWIVSEVRGTSPVDGPAVSGWCDSLGNEEVSDGSKP